MAVNVQVTANVTLTVTIAVDVTIACERSAAPALSATTPTLPSQQAVHPRPRRRTRPR
jgi:hypothetical protein